METQKLDYNDKDQALEILKRFKKKYLHNNIEELKDFSFWYILTDEEFNGVSFDGNKFDGDRTRIVYAIDKLLYDEKKIPNFTLGPKGNYTGDTINTFRTLFGNRFIFQGKKNCEEIIEDKFNFDDELKKKKNNFFWTYQTIGNFYLLPNATIVYENSRKASEKDQSINKYRGTVSNWKDYFDVFLSKFEKCLDSTIELKEDEVFLKRLIQTGKNQQFFYSYCMGKLKNFLSVFYLENYSPNLFAHEKDYYYGHSKYRSANTTSYKNFASDYITKATNLINNRSTRIIKELLAQYPELK